MPRPGPFTPTTRPQVRRRLRRHYVVAHRVLLRHRSRAGPPALAPPPVRPWRIARVLDPSLRGIIASLHTPFDGQGQVDEASVRRLVDHCVAAGCVGVIAPAVAGEVGSLNAGEQGRAPRHRRRGRGRAPRYVAGVSAPTVEDSVATARVARAVCRHGRLAAARQPLARGDRARHRQLADAGPGRVMLQDLDWQGGGLDVGVIAAIARRVPGLAAVKVETVPAGPEYTALRDAVGDRLHLSGGWAAMQMLDGLARGLDAFVPSGLLPVYVRVFGLFTGGRRGVARALFERMLPVITFSNQHIEVSIRFWKRYRLRQGSSPPTTAARGCARSTPCNRQRRS